MAITHAAAHSSAWHRNFAVLAILAVGLGVPAGAVVVRAPQMAAVLAVGTLLFAIAVAAARTLPRAFLLFHGALLLGYAFFGRSFAYLGFRPVFVGELAFALGVAALILTAARRRVLDSWLTVIILLFCVWGAARTLPFIGVHGMDAVRDAVVWGYAAFAVVVASCLTFTGRTEAAIASYGRWVPLFILWVPCAFAIFRIAGEAMPTLPWADVPILTFKAGDFGVHLAGAAAFLLVGLPRGVGPVGRIGNRVLIASWLLGCMIVASTNRGGFLAIGAAMVVIALMHPRSAGLRLLFLSVLLAAAALVLVVTRESGPGSVESDRIVSVSQIVENVKSIVSADADGRLTGTREWRLQWWTDIVNYTVFGDYFWGGKGFGVNLADDDGYQVTWDSSLRSPHNVHLTILARSGVPGLLLWLSVNLFFVGLMLAGHLRARMAGQIWHARACTWLLAYWAALSVNASFDVFIEGPQGGIWFWSILGCGIAVVEAARRDRLARTWTASQFNRRVTNPIRAAAYAER